MRIIWLEMKKALCSPIVLILLLLMSGYNLLVISETEKSPSLKVVNEIIEQYGPTFNDDILHQMMLDLKKDFYKTTNEEHIGRFFEEMTAEKYESMDTSTKQQIDKFQTRYAYIQNAKTLEERYKSIDVSDVEKGFLKDFPGLPAWLKHDMHYQFNKWQVRVDEIVATEEYKQWYFSGENRMHRQLFSTIKKVALEGVLLSVLITAFIINYEFERRTHLLVYATKKGKRLNGHKAVASILSSFLVMTVLLAITMGAYFLKYDYSGIWQISITSGFNWEAGLPNITWWNIPLWQYLVYVLVILAIVLVLIICFTIALGMFLKNSYYTWLICITVLLGMFVVPSFFGDSPILWLGHLNIVLLLLNPAHYFSLGNTFMTVEHYEIYSLVLWSILTLGCLYVAARYFKKKDVV